MVMRMGLKQRALVGLDMHLRCYDSNYMSHIKHCSDSSGAKQP